MTKLTKERRVHETDSEVSSVEYNEDGTLTFKAISISDEFLEKDWMDYAAKDSQGKHVVYRHRLPSDPEHSDEPYYGRVLESRVFEREGKHYIESDYLIKGLLTRRKKLQELVERRQKEGRPMGISMHYDVYKKGDEIADLDVIEHSLTWMPAVKEAVVLEEALHMPKKNEKNKDPEEEKTDEIQRQLDEKQIEQLEALEKELEKATSKLEELEGKLEKEREAKEDAEGKLTKLVPKLDELSGKVAELESHNERLEKKPIIDEIVKLEGDKQLADWGFYDNLSIEKLQERLEYLKSRPPKDPKIDVGKTDEELEREEKEREGHKDSIVKSLIQMGFSKEEIEKYGALDS